MHYKLIPFNEKLRLAALKEYNILNTGPDEDYDNLTFLAAAICEVPVAKISVVDNDRIWNKSVYGGKIQEIERENSFCDKAIHSEDSTLILNRSETPKVFEMAKGIYEREFSFYAGVPLHNSQGHTIAVFCIFDTEEKTLSSTQKRALKALAQQALKLFEFRKQKKQTF